jgi:hypothetical protein
MTIDDAYAAFADALAAALVESGYLADATELQVDPESLIEPTGDETDIVRTAALEKIQTGPVRQILGLPSQRYVVERQCRVELMASGPAREDRLEVDAAAVAAVAVLPNTLPTLGGACERLLLTGVEDEPVAPNGVAKIFTFTIRVRSGDPLGMTA